MDRAAVFQWAKDQFGTEPEYLWANHPRYAVLRNSVNGKWYAVVMEIPGSKLGRQGDSPVDVLNLKCGPVLSGSLRQEPGFFPAYHMNKTHWITAILDGTIPDQTLESFITLSYELTCPGKKQPL